MLHDLTTPHLTPGPTGLRMAHLSFRPHPMAEDAAHALDALPGFDTKLFEAMRTVKQAVVEFPNGWRLSFLTHVPYSSFGEVVKGDERIPTYEVAVIDPDGAMEGNPHAHLGVTEAEALIHAVMSRDYVGGRHL